MPSETGNALRRLGLALLDATLLLAAIVLLLAVMLVWQLRGFAEDMRVGLRSELVALQPQVAAARENARAALESLGEDPDAPGDADARRELRALIDRLDALDPAVAAPDETESLMRQLVLAIIATAARGVLGQERAE